MGAKANSAPARPGRNSRKPANGRSKRKATGLLLSKVSPRMVIMVILCAFFVAFAVGPTLRNLDATARLKKKEVELEAEKKTTTSLDDEVKEAKSLEYVEKEARRQRMVSPGETLYLVTSADSSSKVRYRVKNLQSLDEAWERVRVMINCGYSRSEKAP